MVKNKLYQNKEWLYNKYWIENLSLRQIAKLCGKSHSYVNNLMKKYNITLRYNINLKNYKDFNKKQIKNLYYKKGLSANQIAELYNVCHQTILNWMNKFNIHRRSFGEITTLRNLSNSNHCDLSRKAIEFINGECLGDGHIGSQSKFSAFFAYGSAKEKYAKYISEILKSFGINQAGKIRKYYHKKMDCWSYNYQSLSYIELLDLRNKWYPNGKKIVPKDIKLTPLTCRQWYIGDGSLNHSNKNPNIKLAACGFAMPDVELLIKQLNKLKFKATRQKHNIIHISSYSTKAFLNYIGKCPVKCYEYKWACNDR